MSELMVTGACTQPNCDGRTVPVTKSGRFYLYRNMHMLVPDRIAIPRCTTCQQDCPDQESLKEVTEALEASYLEHKPIIDAVIKEFRARKSPVK